MTICASRASTSDHDDAAEVAQHPRVAVRHLDRPGEPQRRQQQQRQPVPDARQPVAQRGDRAARILRARAISLPHRPALLQDDDAEEDVIDQPDRLQQRVVRGVRQAEQQPDLGERVAEHADHDDAPGPAHGVGGRSVGQCQQAQARLTGARTSCARRTGWRRTARRRRSPRAGRGVAESSPPRAVAATRWPTSRKASTGNSSRTQRPSTSGTRRSSVSAAIAAAVGRLRSRRFRRAPRRLPRRRWSPLGAWRTSARIGRWMARRTAHSTARPTASTSARRQAVSSRTPRAQESVAITFSQHHSSGTLRTAPKRGDHLVGHVVQEAGGADQHLGAKTVRGDRHERRGWPGLAGRAAAGLRRWFAAW